MDHSVVTLPTVASILPAELVRLKTFLRIETDDEDYDLLEYYLAAAQMFEQLTGRGVFTTTRVLRLPCLEDRVVELPYPNLLSVTSVKYYDDDDTEQTLAASGNYIVETSATPGRVTFTDDGLDAIDELSDILLNPISITYTSGYGDDSNDVPIGVRQWMREYVKWSYGVKNNATLSRQGIPEYLSHMAGVWRLGRIW